MGKYNHYNKINNCVSYQFSYYFCSKAKTTLATFAGFRHFWDIAIWLTPDDHCMTLDPNNALHSGQGFFLPHLVTKAYS